MGTPAVTGRTASVATGFHINGRLAESFVCDLRYRNAWTVTGCVLASAA